MNQKALPKTLIWWFQIEKTHIGLHEKNMRFNPFKPEFTIVIFIHYKPQIAVAILNL